MELLKQKTLVVGVCTDGRERTDDGPGTAPGYFLDVNGVACGLVFSFWSNGNWILVDRQFGKRYGEYETFDEAAAAVKDGAWVRQKHDEMAAADPELAKKKDDSKELYRIDNPLKGRPGITLVPDSSATLSRVNDMEEWDDDSEDDWDDEEEDWDDEDDWIDAEVEDGDEIVEDDWDAVVNEEDEDWDDAADEEDDDWDVVVGEEEDEDDWDDAADDDDDWDDVDDDWDDEEEDVAAPPLEPRAAYIVDVSQMPVAIYPLLHAGAVTWWEAFDVGTGCPLWSTQSLSELIRVVPLLLVVVRSVDQPRITVPYIESIAEVFDGLSRQSGEDYLRTGYLKANGREYLDLLNRLYLDPLVLEDAFAAAFRLDD